jgi:protein-L-isoaspartate(D-aspartate) O-methyltransferase
VTALSRLIGELRETIGDERVLEAIAGVPRERFVLPDDIHRAYENVALPIGAGQTISQPLVVGRMLQLLAVSPGERVLDVGTGSGYHAALLAHLGATVLSIERVPELAEAARGRLRALGVTGVEVLLGDGSRGVAERAPFDAVNIAAAAAHDVAPELLAQLADGGRLVAPVARGEEQCLVHLRRRGPRIERVELETVRFVPLVGEPSVEQPQG